MHSSDAEAVDWGLVTCLQDDNPKPYAVKFISKGGDPGHLVRIDWLRRALECGGPVIIGKRSMPGLPSSWSPRQRVWSFLASKVIAGNDHHEPLAFGPDKVLRVLLDGGSATSGPLCDDDGVVNNDAMHRLVLLTFADRNRLQARGILPPGPNIGGDALVNAHRALQLEIVKGFVQRKRSVAGHGLLPSARAVRLSMARARTCLLYLRTVVSPSMPFEGWWAPDSGYSQVENRLLFHWDDDTDGAAVRGPDVPLGKRTSRPRSQSGLQSSKRQKTA